MGGYEGRKRYRRYGRLAPDAMGHFFRFIPLQSWWYGLPVPRGPVSSLDPVTGENGRTRHVSIPASLVQLLVPFLSYCRGSDPHGGSSAAGWLATSTRCLFKAAVVLRRKHDRSDLPPDPPARPPALNSGTQPRSCAPTCRKMTQAVVRRRGTSQATGFPGVEQRPRSRRPRSHLPACK